MAASEHRRDTRHNPPEWVEIACGLTGLRFIRKEDGVHVSSRFSLEPRRGRANTYLPRREDFVDCCRLAKSILFPRREIAPRAHWMDERDD